MATSTYESAREEDCLVCGFLMKQFVCPLNTKFEDFLPKLNQEFDLKNPQILDMDGDYVYTSAQAFAKMHEHKLGMTMAELQEAGEVEEGKTFSVMVLDKNIASKMVLSVTLTDVE